MAATGKGGGGGEEPATSTRRKGRAARGVAAVEGKFLRRPDDLDPQRARTAGYGREQRLAAASWRRASSSVFVHESDGNEDVPQER